MIVVLLQQHVIKLSSFYVRHYLKSNVGQGKYIRVSFCHNRGTFFIKDEHFMLKRFAISQKSTSNICTGTPIGINFTIDNQLFDNCHHLGKNGNHRTDNIVAILQMWKRIRCVLHTLTHPGTHTTRHIKTQEPFKLFFARRTFTLFCCNWGGSFHIYSTLLCRRTYSAITI